MRCVLCEKEFPEQDLPFICDSCADGCTYDVERNHKQELFTGGY